MRPSGAWAAYDGPERGSAGRFIWEEVALVLGMAEFDLSGVAAAFDRVAQNDPTASKRLRILPLLPWLILGPLVAVEVPLVIFLPLLFANDQGYRIVGRLGFSMVLAAGWGLVDLWLVRSFRAMVDIPVTRIEIHPGGFVLHSRSRRSYRRLWSSSFLKFQLAERNPSIVPKVEMPGLSGALWGWGLPLTFLTQDSREGLLGSAATGGAVVKQVNDERGSRILVLGGSRRR